MSTLTVTRPEAGEYAEYYGKYITQAAESGAIEALERSMAEALPVLRAIPESRGGHRYAPGKWSIKETLGHLIDTERVFAYRALWFARQDQQPLPGFDENLWVPAGRFDRLPLTDLVSEWEQVRASNLSFFRGLDAEAWKRQGRANDNPFSVRALAYITAGHGRHHLEILRTRYL